MIEKHTININHDHLSSHKTGRNTRPITQMSKGEQQAIQRTIYPVVVDVKYEFLKALPRQVTLREKRKMMQWLNIATNAVLRKDCLLFDVAE